MMGFVYILVFITAALLVIILSEIFLYRRRQIETRLKSIQRMDPILSDEDALRLPIADRLIKPGYEKFLRLIGNIAPKQIRQKYENAINNAGLGKNVTFARIIGIQIMFSMLFGSFFLIISKGRLNNNIILILVAILIAFILPFSFVRTKADQRSKKIRRSLPDFLDLLYVSVEAGLGFDMALQKTSDKMPGPLSEEITKILDEVSKGRNRQDALRGMANRIGIDELSYFVTSVIQTEQLGSNITNVLKVQSNTMRQKRRQRAEEAAAKVPVKMLFPLVFFIFPTLFIVVLGPAIIRIIDTLGKVF
jgi:tight adherence protein C